MTDEKIITPAHFVNDSRLALPANFGVPTQVANPTRTTWRTVVQSVVGILVVLVPLLNVVTATVIDYLGKQTDVDVPGWVFLALNGILAVTALVIGLVARIMAIPGVANFIAKYLPWLAPIKPTSDR